MVAKNFLPFIRKSMAEQLVWDNKLSVMSNFYNSLQINTDDAGYGKINEVTGELQNGLPKYYTYDFTEKGITALANCAGLEVQSVTYDSFEFQFKGSEQARHLRAGHKDGLSFSRRQIRQFRKRAEVLNRARDGDQACFILSQRKVGATRGGDVR